MQSIAGRTNYAMNDEKMKDSVPVIGYACDPRSVDEEFLLSKKEYEYNTGRNNGHKNVIAYHIRQSFKPGEITPQEARDVGYELAMRLTKGKHAFIVAVHTDTKHIHCAIVFNSTRLDNRGKFNNFRNSSFAIRRLSDHICLEHGLSVIENPKPSKGQNYAEWLGDKEPSWSEKLRWKIDELLPSCTSFEDFIAALKSADCTVRDKRKHISVMLPGQGRAIRLNTLGGDYTEEAIRERIDGVRIITSSGDGLMKNPATEQQSGGNNSVEQHNGNGNSAEHQDGTEQTKTLSTTQQDDGNFVEQNGNNPIEQANNQVFQTTERKADGQEHQHTAKANSRVFQSASNNTSGQPFQPAERKVSLLIDIQSKIQEGKGGGYERWARIFNIKEMSRTLMFLKENGIDSYDELVEKSSLASGDFSVLTKKIKDAETRMAEISELQKHIGTYGKTREIYNQYIKSGRSETFYEEHRSEITLHIAAKNHFDSLGYGRDKKLPTISALKQEYAALLAEKKKLYTGYRAAKENMVALATAKANADKILGVKPETQTRDNSRNASHAEKRNNPPEI